MRAELSIKGKKPGAKGINAPKARVALRLASRRAKIPKFDLEELKLLKQIDFLQSFFAHLCTIH